VLAASLAIASCSRECTEPLASQFPSSQFVPETWLIDAGVPEARPKLVSGWSEDEMWGEAGFLFVWATGPSSAIRINRYGDANVRLRFRCAPNELPDKGQQTVTTVVAGTPVATTELRSGFNIYEISVPASTMDPGESIVEFRYRYSGRPLSPGSSDTRDLAVAWDWIEILEPRARPHARMAREDQNSIILPYRAALRFPVDGTSQRAFAADAIEVDGRAQPGTAGKVLLRLLSQERRPLASITVIPESRAIRFRFPERLHERMLLEIIAIEPHGAASAAALGVVIRNPRIVQRHCK
jgi:hypothetical protein